MKINTEYLIWKFSMNIYKFKLNHFLKLDTHKKIIKKIIIKEMKGKVKQKLHSKISKNQIDNLIKKE